LAIIHLKDSKLLCLFKEIITLSTTAKKITVKVITPRRFRVVAVFLGVVFLNMIEINCKISYDEVNKQLIQEFPNGTQLITCTKTGITGVFISGEFKSRYEYLSISEYMDLQLQVMNIK
jgi:hypothetical protein